MQQTPELSIIIVSYNVRELLLSCIKSIIDTTANIDYEIIVVDNASKDGSAQAVQEAFPQVQVIANEENVGFASANNQGYALSKGHFLLLLNPDTIVKPNAIGSVLKFIKNTPDAGMAGCRLLNPDETLQKSIKSFPSVKENLLHALFINHIISPEYKYKTYYRNRPFIIDYCSGAFMMVRRKALEDMQLFDPELFMYSEEKDIALRLKENNWKTYFVPFGEIIHFGGKSTDKMPIQMFLELQKSQVKFYALHYSKLRAWLLSISWGLVILSNFFVSIPLLFLGKFKRIRLFFTALISYPSIMIETLGN